MAERFGYRWGCHKGGPCKCLTPKVGNLWKLTPCLLPTYRESLLQPTALQYTMIEELEYPDNRLTMKDNEHFDRK